MTIDGSNDSEIYPCAGLKGKYHFNTLPDLAVPNEQILDSGPITIASKEDLDNIMNAEIDQYHEEFASDDEDDAEIVLSTEEYDNQLVPEITTQEDDEDDWQHALSLAGEIEGIPWEFNELSQSKIPERLPAYAIIYHKQHWELVKIEKQNADLTYRYKVHMQNTYSAYGSHELNIIDCGKQNTSSKRWVMLQKIRSQQV
jgi:hypothetical protein